MGHRLSKGAVKKVFGKGNVGPHSDMQVEADPLKPNLTLLMKLGSIIVHFDEYFRPGGNLLDRITAQGFVADPQVQAWIKAMGVYLPKKRS